MDERRSPKEKRDHIRVSGLARRRSSREHSGPWDSAASPGSAGGSAVRVAGRVGEALAGGHLSSHSVSPHGGQAHVDSRSPRVVALYDEAHRIARTDLPVLLSGETGSGKEVLARFIHRSSPRRHGPLVAVNCAALPRDLVESELLGVERGAATGVEARPGRLELASGGSLLLDEVGEMAPSAQAVLLRAVEEGVVTRVGGIVPRSVSVRLICATNRALSDLASGVGFRQDLYFRLASWAVDLPPLRQRREDIPDLAVAFMHEAEACFSNTVAGFSAEALAALVAHTWPGNIRQLRHTVHRAVALAELGSTIDVDQLSLASVEASMPPNGASLSLSEQLAHHERGIVWSALNATSWDFESAALQLRVSVSTLYRRVRELGLSQRP